MNPSSPLGRGLAVTTTRMQDLSKIGFDASVLEVSAR